MERLQKAMANAGVASRRKSEDLIVDGHVKVNGELVTELGTKVSKTDVIEVDGVPIYKEEPKYIMLYKPKNVISAVSDPTDRQVVVDFIHGVEERIYPIGRLDFDTTGLILLTNDGDFAHRLLAPSRHHSKVYFASIEGKMDQEDVAAFKQGIVLDTGYRCKEANLEILEETETGCNVKIEIFEGKFHQIKKMVAACNKKVIYLKRLSIKNLQLDRTLELGDFRELSPMELVDLMNDL